MFFKTHHRDGSQQKAWLAVIPHDQYVMSPSVFEGPHKLPRGTVNLQDGWCDWCVQGHNRQCPTRHFPCGTVVERPHSQSWTGASGCPGQCGQEHGEPSSPQIPAPVGQLIFSLFCEFFSAWDQVSSTERPCTDWPCPWASLRIHRAGSSSACSRLSPGSSLLSEPWAAASEWAFFSCSHQLQITEKQVLFSFSVQQLQAQSL